ncbi:MAG: transporter [Alistipes sp.]|nr:transporter [Alistipes sp.]
MALSRQTIKTIVMPLAMVVGAMLCRPLAHVEAASANLLTPMLIASMLFLTFCRIDLRDLRLRWVHLIMLAVQIVGGVVVYVALRPLLGEVVAQGAMMCVLAPIAMAAVVIGGMLGAKVAPMVSYSLICNIVTAIVLPPILHAFGNGTCTFVEIISRVAPTLIAPFVVAQLLRYTLPKVAKWFANHSSYSFYLWLFSLVLVMGRTTAFIIDTPADIVVEIELALVALLLCLAQFRLGRYIGERSGDRVAGAQSVGQKNTILAIWLTLNFLNPIASIAPTAYIVWQNFVNSYQIYRKNLS